MVNRRITAPTKATTISFQIFTSVWAPCVTGVQDEAADDGADQADDDVANETEPGAAYHEAGQHARY